MNLTDVLTVILTGINFIFVVISSMITIRREKAERMNNKKNAWYKSEIFSMPKIDAYLAEIKRILTDATLLPTEKCRRVNDRMLSFNAAIIDYIKFYDKSYADKIRIQNIKAIDDVIYAVLYLSGKGTPADFDKIVNTYRITLIYLFYKFDLTMDA